MKIPSYIIITIILVLSLNGNLPGQKAFIPGVTLTRPADLRARDSVLAMKVPLLECTPELLKRQLPPVVDNSMKSCWPGIKDQYMFYTCQQYCGVTYVFGYEINRLRHRDARLPENSYPAHYTWNFMNNGERYTGVDYLQSFEFIRQQGHMTSDDYGPDTATQYTGWISGYEQYYRGMSNRLRDVRAIRVNGEEGINTLKNFLYDHLDGSADGGIACFTTSSATLNSMPRLAEGTPEEGKYIVSSFNPEPVHGLTIVGYNDSVRYDENNDGRYTNDEDITGDGIVDARDWEIGAFIIANSYGTWWGNEGFTYAPYRLFALDYGDGGIWNNRAYVVEADTACRPLLAMKVKLTCNLRNLIRVMAGVSVDTLDQIPREVMEVPGFSFQGGMYPMQGDDPRDEAATLEFGLDITPLLNAVPSGRPARFFLVVEERDPDQSGHGVIDGASLISYFDGQVEIPLGGTDVPIRDNNITLVSAVADFSKPDLHITTAGLPAWAGTEPLQVALEAAGGTPPCHWSLIEDYIEKPSMTQEPAIGGASIAYQDETRSFTPVALPFPFPFYGKEYDTIYVNYYGFIAFGAEHLPLPYTTEEAEMLRMFPVIAPAFSLQYAILPASGGGIWYDPGPAGAVIRWKAANKDDHGIAYDFALILHPDGRFESCYGEMGGGASGLPVFRGVSKGDGVNSRITTVWNAAGLSGTSLVYCPPVVPTGVSLSDPGILTLERADPTVIYDLEVRVTDAQRLSDNRLLMLSSGLEMHEELLCGESGKLVAGEPAFLTLAITNTGERTIRDLELRIIPQDTLLDIADSSCFLALIDPQDTDTLPAAFAFSLHRPLPDGYPVMLTLQATADSGSWHRMLNIPVAAPAIILGAPSVSDGYNDRLDPGEVAGLVVDVRNAGSLEARNVMVKLTTRDGEVEILSDSALSVDRLDVYSSVDLHFMLRASRDVAPGTASPARLEISTPAGILASKEFILQIGAKPVLIADLAVNHGSAGSMMAALQSLDAAFDTVRSLHIDPRTYESIFLILGTAPTGTHPLTAQEGELLAAYLRQGGKLYMESYQTWYYLNNTALHPLFRYTSKKVRAYYYTEIRGVDETFCSSVSFGYNGPPNYAVFDFEPVAPAFASLVNTDNPPRNLEIAYDGDDYKTIGSITGFGSYNLNDHPTTLPDLMERYLNFFIINLTGPWPLFHADTKPICRGQTIAFTDDSFDNIVSRQWTFAGGTPSSSTETNPVVQYDQSGRYDVILTVSDGIHTKSIRKKQYVEVGNCQGADEQVSGRPLFRVFPNPVSGVLNVERDQYTSGDIRLVIYDLLGHNLLETHSNASGGSTLAVDFSDFPPGLYFLRCQTASSIFTVKVLKE